MPTSKGAPRAVIIQPTPFCNIDCSYCYLRNRNNPRCMSDITFTEIFNQIASICTDNTTISVIWHAGEPLTPGHRWYRESFAKIASIAKDHFIVEHRIQTNATLISDEWCNVFRDFNVQLGISLDGPERIHNAHRKTRQGRGTHGSVMNGLSRLKENGVYYGVICVITSESVNRPDEMFDFFSKLGVNRISFNCDEIKGSNTHSSMRQQLKTYRRFVSRFWELARSSDRTWFIRDIELLID